MNDTIFLLRSARKPLGRSRWRGAFLAGSRAWVFERSEFPSPPPKAPRQGKTAPQGRLSLGTFFGEAKKVPGRAAVKRNLKTRKSAEKLLQKPAETTIRERFFPALSSPKARAAREDFGLCQPFESKTP